MGEAIISRNGSSSGNSGLGLKASAGGIIINDLDNNIVGYKGYKMIGYQLCDENGNPVSETTSKYVNIELRDAELGEKAIDNYANGDLVNIDASTHTYQLQKIIKITTNSAGNSVITLEEVNSSKISFTLETISETATNEEKDQFERIENWLWIAGKSYGEYMHMLSHAFASGDTTKAIGWGAFTAGRQNEVFGNYGTAIGRKNLAAFCALATGLQTKAIGLRAVTFGNNTLASGADSIAMGAKSKAYGMSSFAGGDASIASSQGSFAYGLRAKANNSYQTVFGKDNAEDSNALFIIGNGTLNSKSNAFKVNKNASVSIGNTAAALGNNSFVIGTNSEAQNENSFAGGNNCHAIGLGSFTYGLNNYANANYSFAQGNGVQASGIYSFAIGYSTRAIGASSFAGGSASYANNECSFSFGLRTKTNNNYQVVFGRDNAEDSNAVLIVGNGTNASKSNVFTVNKNGTATVKTNPQKDMDVATKQYTDSLKEEILNDVANEYTPSVLIESRYAEIDYVDRVCGELIGIGTSLPSASSSDAPKFFVLID